MSLDLVCPFHNLEASLHERQGVNLPFQVEQKVLVSRETVIDQLFAQTFKFPENFST